ncbi:hypothetical protein BDC45DRAFT_566146 [Circinella umbellata]|nr:hypothetical protein BDC45DRAFT_566146 [Circinella umbellata]
MSKRPFIQNQYFQDTPLAQWSFDSYLGYTNERQSRKSKNTALLNSFRNQLINMKRKKIFANNLDSDINENQEAQASSSTPTVTNISGQGSSLIHNGDNYNGIVIAEAEAEDADVAVAEEVAEAKRIKMTPVSAYNPPLQSKDLQAAIGFVFPADLTALSSILLVKPGQIHDDLYTTFGTASIHELQDHRKKDFQLGPTSDQLGSSLENTGN